MLTKWGAKDERAGKQRAAAPLWSAAHSSNNPAFYDKGLMQPRKPAIFANNAVCKVSYRIWTLSG